MPINRFVRVHNNLFSFLCIKSVAGFYAFCEHASVTIPTCNRNIHYVIEILARRASFHFMKLAIKETTYLVGVFKSLTAMFKKKRVPE